MKIAAVVILYHPTENTLDNIKTYAKAVDKVYVFDNTEEGTFLKKNLMEIPNITYLHDNHNAGIAKRLNTSAQMAINEGFDWLLMMDQDSKFEGNAIQYYWDGVSKFPHPENVGLFGPQFSRNNKQSLAQSSYQEIDGMITSGTLLNLNIYQQIGKFDEALFIDAVDIEYCLRVQKAGFKMIQLINVFIQHELGQTEKKASIKTLYLIKKEKELHSPLRYYYMYRNNLYVQSKYKGFDKQTMQKINRNAMSFLKKGFFYGSNSWEIVKYIVEARRDFKQNKMGKYQSNT
ncbi:glycosyltransferase family 2 protein [Arcicella lustrica]|uniref:Glycosyltransferase family 2 protein n=1 Tax=Arcicella lustrica TaxID=2984196 RepID=A0ABU5SIU5_9BACT|nr:glycosyltransferase family 2 protein [Arcicella sp. DC25W]MEA5427189.1 glycosyltransferase family 2 protein [Arcicella sp. DC25W]